jgi:hypothetical protein
MSNLTYIFEGVNKTLTEEERRPFNNHRDNPDCVPTNTNTVFNLRDGRVYTGRAVNIDLLYGIDGDFNKFEPLQARFTIITENGDEINLSFLEILSHNPPPFKPTHFFK